MRALLTVLTLGSLLPREDDPVARVTASLRPVVQLAGAAPVRYRLDERMKHYRVPGVSTAVAISGRLAWARGFGVKQAGTADRVDAATLFQAGSIGKPIAATATLGLVDRGKLSLDQDVARYLTSWKLPESAFTATEKVTLRRLLSHTAGINVPTCPGYRVDERIPTLRQVLEGRKPANTEPVRVEAVPGSVCRYSGGGVTIEQQVLIDVTGKPFAALVGELVFGPIGMASSTFEQELPAALRARASADHLSSGEMIPGRHLIHPALAAAGLWTTPTDLLAWAMEIAAARAGTRHRVISQAMAREMLIVQKGPVGLGPFVRGSGRGLQFWHAGWNEGFHARVIYFPEIDAGAAVMANGDGGRALLPEILQAIAAEYGWPGAGPPEVIQPLPVDSKALDRVTGAYEGGKPIRVAATLSREGAKLFLDAPKLGTRTEIVFTAPTELLAVETRDRFSVTTGADGSVTALVWGNVIMPRQRPSPPPPPRH
jgi:CubicO group peptidase (beta-lactamase class C family)